VSDQEEQNKPASRRGFLATTAALIAGASAGLALRGSSAQADAPSTQPAPAPASAAEPFYGEHQSGILTPLQSHTYFAAFDLTTDNRDAVAQLLQTWTAAAARMTAGQPADAIQDDTTQPAADTGEAIGLPPARLTVTFGFGPGLFVKDGKDRYGLAAHRPEALIDLPVFNGDQLIKAKTGGDLSVQACSDDPQVAFHAVRQLARLAYDVAQLRWAQTGFLPEITPGQTPRNLMGFKDGTHNPNIKSDAAMNKFVWVGDEGPAWMTGGSYVVIRRIRIALEHWDRTAVDFQEKTIGRHKYSGAPLTGNKEFDHPDYDAVDGNGDPVMPENSHMRLAEDRFNDGAKILRRPYSYNDGVNFTSERWPPWRQGMEYDAGLFFIAYQRDVRHGFAKIYEKMSKFDMLNQFVTHTASGIFAVPPGVSEGRWIGQGLFEKG
jgi:deferrochelatase/peroxidase EfeB